jgi:hypothetical protein
VKAIYPKETGMQPLLHFFVGFFCIIIDSFRLEFNEDVLIGDEILYLNPELQYNVAFPIQRGDVNLSQAIGKVP